VNGRYEPEDEDLDVDPDPYMDEAQPDHFCECRPGAELRERWQHAPDCRRWTPPLGGPGSTPAHRAAALAHIRAQIAGTRHRQQEGDA
jgi:hypothetical protein